jgi:probable phosphoglycerate mutase
MIRHAQTRSNVLGLLDSEIPGADLTSHGRRQAAAIPGALHGRPISSITVSNMVRTAQTAAPLANSRGLDIRVDARLREIEAGEMEMASGSDALQRYVDVAWAWAAGDLDVRMPGAQNGWEFFRRFDAAVDDAVMSGGPDPVVVSHAAAIRVWVGGRCDNVTDVFAAESAMHNTGSAVVERGAEGSWQLVEWNAMPLGGAELHARSGPGDDGPTGSMTEDDMRD